MREPTEPQISKLVRRIAMHLIGIISTLMLLIDLGVLCIYFGWMSMMMLLSLQFAEPVKFIGMIIHMLVAISCFVALVGVVLCFAGIVSRKWFFKYLLLTLSIVGVSSLPLAIYEGLDDAELVKLLAYLAG
jgi:hypothetical protein